MQNAPTTLTVDATELVDEMAADFTVVIARHYSGEAEVNHLERALEIGEPEFPEDY